MYKRSKAICSALMELYSRQMLNVSFEIAYDTLLVVDGVEYIDASANNVITGMAIVSRPAYPEAFATRMVAEATGHREPVAEDHKENQAAHAAEKPIDKPEGVHEMTLDEAKNKIADLESEVQELTRQ